eukprot:TRINITY_DN14116_c0_g1_i1.p1 TRINITY_DN14116_c0_g1~~TRINITY_DN14116_c0_g1_i1.p1  ORF type:complete len:1291 (-),score=258.45 TRINITY_DN14116_c0_g1_i1:236-4108(-)
MSAQEAAAAAPLSPTIGETEAFADPAAPGPATAPASLDELLEQLAAAPWRRKSPTSARGFEKFAGISLDRSSPLTASTAASPPLQVDTDLFLESPASRFYWESPCEASPPISPAGDYGFGPPGSGRPRGGFSAPPSGCLDPGVLGRRPAKPQTPRGIESRQLPLLHIATSGVDSPLSPAAARRLFHIPPHTAPAVGPTRGAANRDNLPGIATPISEPGGWLQPGSEFGSSLNLEASAATPRAATADWQEIRLKGTGRKGELWDADTWNEKRSAAADRGVYKELLELQRSVQKSTQWAVQHGFYYMPPATPKGLNTKVDLFNVSKIGPVEDPQVDWYGRDNVSIPRNFMMCESKKIPPPLLISDRSPMDVVIRLRETLPPQQPIVLVAEAFQFLPDTGVVDAWHPAGMSPHCLPLRSDLTRYFAAAAEQIRRGRATMREHLTAVRDPYVFLCRDVTIFRGPREDGYPFLSKHTKIHVLMMAMSSSTPTVQTVLEKRNVGLPTGSCTRTEWYRDQTEHTSLQERLNLVGPAVLQEVRAEAATTANGAATEELPPVLVFSVPGTGGICPHPKDAVATSLKQWRRRFSNGFHSVFVCTGGRGEAKSEALAKHLDACVNSQLQRVQLEDSPILKKLLPWHWDKKVLSLSINKEQYEKVAELLGHRRDEFAPAIQLIKVNGQGTSKSPRDVVSPAPAPAASEPASLNVTRASAGTFDFDMNALLRGIEQVERKERKSMLINQKATSKASSRQGSVDSMSSDSSAGGVPATTYLSVDAQENRISEENQRNSGQLAAPKPKAESLMKQLEKRASCVINQPGGRKITELRRVTTTNKLGFANEEPAVDPNTTHDIVFLDTNTFGHEAKGGTPRGSTRASPRGSPRGSPRASPRVSPRVSPRGSRCGSPEAEYSKTKTMPNLLTPGMTKKTRSAFSSNDGDGLDDGNDGGQVTHAETAPPADSASAFIGVDSDAAAGAKSVSASSPRGSPVGAAESLPASSDAAEPKRRSSLNGPCRSSRRKSADDTGNHGGVSVARRLSAYVSGGDASKLGDFLTDTVAAGSSSTAATMTSTARKHMENMERKYSTKARRMSVDETIGQMGKLCSAGEGEASGGSSGLSPAIARRRNSYGAAPRMGRRNSERTNVELQIREAARKRLMTKRKSQDGDDRVQAMATTPAGTRAAHGSQIRRASTEPAPDVQKSASEWAYDNETSAPHVGNEASHAGTMPSDGDDSPKGGKRNTLQGKISKMKSNGAAPHGSRFSASHAQEAHQQDEPFREHVGKEAFMMGFDASSDDDEA